MPTTSWTLTIDCADAGRLARFWSLALGYAEKPPPEGWDTWEAWLRHFEVPEDEWDDGASLVDPDGVLPSIGFLRVPEAKSTKNRLHLDLQVSGGRHLPDDVRTARIEDVVSRLEAAGGRVVERFHQPSGALDHALMGDPEGNEFCVV